MTAPAEGGPGSETGTEGGTNDTTSTDTGTGGGEGAASSQTSDEPGTGDAGQQSGTGTGDDTKLKEVQAHSRRWEERAKTNKQAADTATAENTALKDTLAALRRALDPDGKSTQEEDPKELAARAAKEHDTAAELRQLRLERAAEKAGRTAGADVDALVDSRGFVVKLHKLDPTADDFEDELKALVDKALVDNPRLKAASTTPPSPARSVTEPGAAQTTQPGSGGDIDSLRNERRKRRDG